MIVITKATNELSYVTDCVNKEFNFIDSSIKSQQSLSMEILNHLNRIFSSIDEDDLPSTLSTYSVKCDEANTILKKCSSNMETYNDLKISLDNIMSYLANNNLEKSVTEINKYNKKYKKVFAEILKNTNEIEIFVQGLAENLKDISVSRKSSYKYDKKYGYI